MPGIRKASDEDILSIISDTPQTLGEIAEKLNMARSSVYVRISKLYINGDVFKYRERVKSTNARVYYIK